MTAHRTMRGAACLAAALLLAGCSNDAAVSDSSAPTQRSSSPAEAPSTPKPPETPTRTEVPVPPDVVGAGCADYVTEVPSGSGALDGMGRDPVAVALSNSPLLTTFAGALMGNLNPEVNLVDAVNTGQFTVFAPTDAAFGKVDPDTIAKWRGDSRLLSGVLDYHVVEGQIGPEDVVGEHKTVQGQPLTVSGSEDRLRVNDAAVVCGGIRTANATVYLIDTVLTPPAPTAPTPTTSATDTTEATATPTP